MFTNAGFTFFYFGYKITIEKDRFERETFMKKNFIKLFLSILAFAFILMPASAYIGKLFPDVNSNHWAAAQIKELSEMGVIVGYPDGTFKPDDNVTRAEFAVMAIKALGQEHTTVAQRLILQT